MDLLKYKLIYFLLSLLLILPGVYFLVQDGLKLGIDFTGGVILEYQFKKPIPTEELKNNIISQGIGVGQITQSGDNTYSIQTKPIEQNQINQLKNNLAARYGPIEEKRVESVGPIIGQELTQKALLSVLIASFVIVIYIAYSFRKVPKTTSSWRFGTVAVVALLHDVLVVVGIFAILGKFFNVEIDTLFVTALLTIIGFSVHDTIVVFDRIRENLLKNIGRKFSEVANISIVQTLGRSLSTSLTVVFVLTALLLFGGETIHWFVVALLIGVISGTYSSIFNATALLAFWEEKLGH